MNLSNKKIVISLVITILLVDVFFVWKYLDNSQKAKMKSQSEEKIDIDKDIDKDILSVIKDPRKDIDKEILPLIKDYGKNIAWDSEIRLSRFNTLDFQLIKYYTCKARKDESYYKEAKDYVNNFEHIDSELKKTYLDYIKRKKDSYFKSHYTTLIVHGDYGEICAEDNLLEKSCRDSVVVLDERIKTRCRELCLYIKKATEDNDFFEKAIMQPKWFYNFSEEDLSQYSEMDVSKLYSSLGVWRYSLAYRIGGESAINRLCEIWFGDNEELADDYSRCNERNQRFLDFTVNKKTIGCDFYLERAQETIDIQLQK